MPMLIEHIDAITRQKQRDVLYVVFNSPASDNNDEKEILGQADLEWETLPTRQQIIDWMNAQGIGWKPCCHFADVNLMMGYRGRLYIDLPFDKSLPAFQALTAFLELPDGSMRFPEATLFYCPLDKAMV